MNRTPLTIYDVVLTYSLIFINTKFIIGKTRVKIINIFTTKIIKPPLIISKKIY